jgi:hypothetical protein
MAGNFVPAFGVRVKMEGIKSSDLIKAIEQRNSEFKAGLKKITETTHKELHNYIETHKKRKGQYNPRGLHSAFKPAKPIIQGRNILIGLGNEEYLNENYPYWKIINFGGFINHSVLGWFGLKQRPDKSQRGQGTEVFHGHDNGYLLTPKAPIRPMNYIEYILNWLNNYWYIYWENYFNK